ncbi:membrane protein [Thermococcus atlanticus]
MRAFPYLILAACILLGGTTQILFKLGMNSVGALDSTEKIFSLKTVIMVLSNKYITAGLMLYAISSVLWIIGLSMLDVSLMYPLLSLAYFVTTVLAFFILNEHIRTSRWIGVLLILVGSILVGLNK